MQQHNRKLSLAVATVLLSAVAVVNAQEATAPAPAQPATAPPESAPPAAAAPESAPQPAAAAGPAKQEPPAPDPEKWVCSKCPFDKGYVSEAYAGAGYVDDTSARFGDYTGLDEEGGVFVAGAEGGVALDSGYRLNYLLENLGLDSRAVAIEGGKQGSYEFGAFYDRIPHRISDTGETIYSGIGSDNLSLPAGWVRAGSTAGMTALGASLRNVEVGYDRDRYGVNGSYLLGDRWAFGLDYRRDERSGTRSKYGSFGTVSTELLRPVDDATDRINATVRYNGANWFAQAGYYLSLYSNDAALLNFQNPFTAFVAGGDAGQLGLEPDNTFSEFSVSFGWYGLPGNSALTGSAAIGQGTQDESFTGYTLNPTIPVDALPFANLDGDVSITRFDLTASSRPIDRLRLRGAVNYDERDNDSRQGAFTSIVHTDLFLVGEDRINAVYGGYERTRLTGSADFDVYHDLTLGVGGEYRNTDRKGSDREVMSETLTDGFGRILFRPMGYLGFVVKGGVQERDPDHYDVALATANGQNPLMRKYDMAYRYRSYGEFQANVALPSAPVSISASAFYGDDSYLQSEIGLVAGLDRRFGLDLNWAMSDKLSVYASAAHEKIDSKTKNSSVFGQPDWRGDVQDDFETYGAGLHAQLTDKIKLNLDYTYADGNTHTQIVGAGAGTFPPVTSQLSSFKTNLEYGMSDRADIVFTWWYETFESRDWAYESQPDALPTVLALGVDPYNYDVNYVTVSMRYRFGVPKAAAEAEAPAPAPAPAPAQ